MLGGLKSLPKRLQCLNRPNLNLRGGSYNPAHYQNTHPTMKLPYLGILLGTAFLCHPVQAVTYICKIDGKAAYSSVKINSSCQKSQMESHQQNLLDEGYHEAFLLYQEHSRE